MSSSTYKNYTLNGCIVVENYLLLLIILVGIKSMKIFYMLQTNKVYFY